MSRLFVIAIGGTGMRCLESFVHLCAMGMFDDREIDILTLDTDQDNGNKGRVETLIDLYKKIKSYDENNPDGGNPTRNTFFSAKLNLYKFYTQYTDANRKTYHNLSRVSSYGHKDENTDLADLFFDKDTVQGFDLSHGYRAQTHLGAMLMYHGVVEAARNVAANKAAATKAEQALKEFLDRLMAHQSDARVFVFGSIFGGTGASSIPVIPVALRDAVNILDPTRTLDTSHVKFGSTLLTEYFSFKAPDAVQKEADKIVADSNNFALNCQAALQFYLEDPTVKRTYKRFYHIGWPFQQMLDVSNRQGATITGGHEQCNPCHVVELLSACAAYDFFRLEDTELNNEEARFMFRVINDDDGKIALKGSDFIDKGSVFENKFGSLFSLAHIILTQYEAAMGGISDKSGTKGLLARFAQQNIKDYQGITEQQARDIDTYFKDFFGYRFDEQQTMVKGWVYQVKSTMPGRFVFNDDAFKEQKNEMKTISCGRLFTDDRHNWSGLTGLINKTDNSVDVLVRKMTDENTKPREEQYRNTKERFLAHIYNAITANQKFHE